MHSWSVGASTKCRIDSLLAEAIFVWTKQGFEYVQRIADTILNSTAVSHFDSKRKQGYSNTMKSEE